MKICTVNIKEVLKDPNLNLSAKHWCNLVSKGQFHEFQKLQKRGDYNMIDPAIRVIIGITKEQHLFILNHYEELRKEYGGI